VMMKLQGLIPAVNPVLDSLRQAQYGVAATVYEQALRAAGEWPHP
jgi:predicted nucleic acid-binding protein